MTAEREYSINLNPARSGIQGIGALGHWGFRV